jgi:hypothetical protein
MGALCQAPGLKFMGRAQGRWVEGINHKIGVEGRSINILIAQLPQQSAVLMYVMWAQLRRVERFTVGRGRKSWSLQGTPRYKLSLQKLLIIQQAEKSSLIEYKSWPTDPVFGQINTVHINHSICDRTGKMLTSILRGSHSMINPLCGGLPLVDWPGLRIPLFALIVSICRLRLTSTTSGRAIAQRKETHWPRKLKTKTGVHVLSTKHSPWRGTLSTLKARKVKARTAEKYKPHTF